MISGNLAVADIKMSTDAAVDVGTGTQEDIAFNDDNYQPSDAAGALVPKRAC